MKKTKKKARSKSKEDDKNMSETGKNEKSTMWIPGPLPLDSHASLQTRSRSPKVCHFVPCRPQVPPHLDVSFTQQPHKRELCTSIKRGG